MNNAKKNLGRAFAATIAIALSFFLAEGAWSEVDSKAKMEYLDRGLVAASVREGVFLSWRLLGNEVTGFSASGLRGTDFAIYRDGARIAFVADGTNYLDKGAAGAHAYQVRAVQDGRELDASPAARPWAGAFYELPLKRPSDSVTPAGEAYAYSANDASVGDVDGDGRYEFFVKWDPSNSKDVSQKGYTGKVFIDCYTFEGELLYRIDMGVNVRAGAHYTQFLVYDFDGDGRSELMMKTAPGTKVERIDANGKAVSGKFITLPKPDIDSGYSNSDDYRVSRTGYYEHVVRMFMDWPGHPEVMAGRWPKTLEACFGIAPQYSYPLSRADAGKLAEYFLDVYAPKRSANNKLREFEGFVMDGPEYLTVFSGSSGEELKTIPYPTERYDDGLMWGDYAMARIEPCNRVDRFLAGVAYLDGLKPAAIFARGYYTRSTVAAYSWDGKKLTRNWFVDSGWTPMSNPFNDGPHGRDGTSPDFGKITTQGAHTFCVADVDGDGRDETVYGSATINDDGSLLYSSTDRMPPGSAAPGSIARLGHGDAIQVADMDPDRPGLEIFMCFEGAAWAPYGAALREAETGKVIYGTYSGKDTGRCMIGDIDPNRRGIETWAIGLWSAKGERIGQAAPGTNASILWSADMTTQVVTGDRDSIALIQRWNPETSKSETILSAEGTRTNNSTKGNPCLVADILGDWREELVLRNVDSSALRIYLSTEISDRKLYTLMHDRKYRIDVARQNSGYNQPAYTSYYLASDIDWSKVPLGLRIRER